MRSRSINVCHGQTYEASKNSAVCLRVVMMNLRLLSEFVLKFFKIMQISKITKWQQQQCDQWWHGWPRNGGSNNDRKVMWEEIKKRFTWRMWNLLRKEWVRLLIWLFTNKSTAFYNLQLGQANEYYSADLQNIHH